MGAFLSTSCARAINMRDLTTPSVCVKIQVGMGAGVSARYVRSLTERSTGRMSGRFGSTGVELEIGASRRLGHSASAGLYVAVGLAVSPHNPALVCQHVQCSWTYVFIALPLQFDMPQARLDGPELQHH